MKYILALTLILTSFFSHSQVNLSNGLIAHYPFTGNTNDISGNGHHAINTYAYLTNSRENVPNSAYYFDGSGSFMKITNDSTMNPQQMTLYARIKPMGFYHGTCYNNCIIDKGSSDYLQGNYTLRFTPGAYTGTCYVDDSLHQNFTGFSHTNGGATLYSPFVQKNTWYDVVYTADNDSLKLYVDGIIKWRAAKQIAIGVNGDDVFLGRKGSVQYPYWFKGVMDEVRIYNRAINEDEVLALLTCSTLMINAQPVNATNCGNTGAGFYVGASNISNYKWQKFNGTTWSDIINDSIYSGTDSARLMINSFNASLNNSQYRVIVSNACYSQISSVATLTIAQSNLTNGLIAHYPFNGNANDISGNNRNPTFNNAVLSSGKEGLANTGYYFNGSNAYMRIANNAALNPQELTLYARVKPMGFYHGICYNNSIIDKGGLSDYQPGNYTLRFTAGAYTNSCYVDDSLHQNFTGFSYTNPGPGIITPFVTKDQWYDVAYTVSSDSQRLYIDGILKWTAPKAVAIGTNTYDLLFGRKDNASYPYWFKGVMDEIRIYNRALNCAEVDSLMNCKNAAITQQPSNRQVCDTGATRFIAVSVNTTTVKWQVNTGSSWVDISNNSKYSGATTDTLNISGVNASMHNYQYRFVASNACNNATSTIAVLQVIPAVAVTQNPVDVNTCGSGFANFNVTVSSSANYQWQVKTGSAWTNITNNSTYTGATGNNLGITGITASFNNYQYRTIVSNTCSSDTSEIATLYVSHNNLTAGLIAHFPFNGNTNDVSGNGHHAVNYNAALTANREGIANSAYSFNGMNSFMQIANNASLSPQQLTLYARIKPTGFYNGTCYNNCIIDKGSTDYQPGNYTLRFTAGAYTGSCYVEDTIHQNFTGFSHTNGGATMYSPFVQKNTWYDVAYTVSNDSLKLYVDGILKWKEARQVAIGVSAEDVFLGRKGSIQYPYWFKGIMDEVRIYNRAISQAEVNALLSCTNTGRYYRTVASGNWNDISIWESSADRINYTPVTVTPDFNSTSISIQAGHAINIIPGAEYSVNNLEILQGATLTIGAASLTVNGKMYVSGIVNALANSNLVTK